MEEVIQQKEIENINVISVSQNKIKLKINNMADFKKSEKAEDNFKIGSYLQIAEKESSDEKTIICVDSFAMEFNEDAEHKIKESYIIECSPVGTLSNNTFIKGVDEITIPPKKVFKINSSIMELILASDMEENSKFTFSKINSMEVPVNGNKFFNKHIAVIGSTGSGKSHTIAKILQNAVNSKQPTFDGLNNSHIVLFDLHSEYKTAFPEANVLNVGNIKLPYWLLNSEELEDLFIESNDSQSYNQISQFRYAVTRNKEMHNCEIVKTGKKIFFDSPVNFNIREVLQYFKNKSKESVLKLDGSKIAFKDGTKTENLEEITNDGKNYFKDNIEFAETGNSGSATGKKGAYANGEFDRLIIRLENIINNNRLDFLFNEQKNNVKLIEVLEQLLGYQTNKNNITIIDLSGIPFEILNIVVSLISRILFDYGFLYKKSKNGTDTPILLVYEEAHKYVPKSDLVKYRSSKTAIERIAKEGRKYGITLMFATQRPSDISENIFSQCNNFICMRLTNIEDQNYVKRLLPDNISSIVNNIPSLKQGEAFIIGDCINMPLLVKIEKCEKDKSPSSNDIKYLEKWKEEWKNVEFEELIEYF
jgi:uncharacterized protein